MPLPSDSRGDPTALEQRLIGDLQTGAPIGVDQFMARALYDPQNGYYTTKRPLGAAGDFTTAPEVSQIFGELVGLWIAQSWLDLGAPSPFHLIELGPGQGTLMADMLRVGQKVPGFLAAMRLHLVETNPHLRSMQQAKLSVYKPNWHGELASVPEGATFLVGNEFLDCMPIRQFVLAPDGWREKQVGVDTTGRLAFGLGPLLPNPPSAARIGDGVGAVREVAPALPAFAGEIASRFARFPGRALLIDYCDTSGSPGDTLQALFKHTKCHPLSHVGEADLTAHVDFVALIQLAEKLGLSTLGPVSQRAFLRSLGVEARKDALIAANPHCASDVQEAVERLIGEAHMGELFAVACLDSLLNGNQGPPLGM